MQVMPNGYCLLLQDFTLTVGITVLQSKYREPQMPLGWTSCQLGARVFEPGSSRAVSQSMCSTKDTGAL